MAGLTLGWVHAAQAFDLAELPPRQMFPIALMAAGVIATVALWLLSRGRRIRRRLRGRLHFMAAALNYANHGISMVDHRRRLTFCNDAYLDIHRLTRADIRTGITIDEIRLLCAERGTLAASIEFVENESAISESLSDLGDGRAILYSRHRLPAGGWILTCADITEQRNLAKQLASTKQFLETVLDNIPIGVAVRTASDERYVLINRSGEKFFRKGRRQVINHTLSEVHASDQAGLIRHRDAAALKNRGQVVVNEYPMVIGDSMRLYKSRRVAASDTPGGPPQYLIMTMEDVTDRRQADARMAHMVHHDGLTDLPNRVAFVQALEQMIDACRGGDEFAVLSIDLDRFKEINDVFGHAIGDRLLIEASKRIESQSMGAVVSRLGGDEFGMIVDGVQPQAGINLAERLIDSMRGEFVIDGKTVRLGATAGIALFPRDGADAASLLANANLALFRAKQEARGSLRVFEPQMDQQIRDRRAMHRELSGALQAGELCLNYQPLAQVGGSVIGFEALVRWNHPARGTVSPGVFIPLAEESGLIIEIGEWILREACREAASWDQPLQIAVNLSPVQFLHGDLVGLVHGILLETGLAPGRLELEITEGVLIGDFDRGLALLRRLKALGVRISMDDFGSGYSSLSYLQSFPFDKIKIDRAFIMNLGTNPQSAAIVRAVIGLGHGLDVPVVAEGVETETQLGFLAAEGCDQVQGYLIGRPAALAQYAGLVHRTAAAELKGRVTSVRQAG